VSASPVKSGAVITTHPLAGVFGVLLGAMIATCTGRLISVGLADLRGALHLGVDEASWIGTAFNAAMMFIGPFSVYLGGLLGARRVLLACASLFTLISFLLPFAPSLPIMLVLLVIAGLTAGTFYPLTLSFVLRNLPMRYVLLGIAMYALDILVATNFATSLEGWYLDHLSWHWIFWNGAALTPIMMVLIYFGIPWQPLPQPKEGQPKPNWRGFLYASLGVALLYIALDQGQRLDWLHSGTIVGLVASGVFLLIMSAVRHLIVPNPLINFKFLLRRNTLLLSGVLILFRFVILATVVTIPSYLASVQGYRPTQTGKVLLWVALPQCVLGLLAMYLVPQIVMAIGLALSFNALVGSIILELLNTGALSRPIDVLTFAGYFQTVRLLGGQIGAAFMQHFIPTREQFHSNILGLDVQLGQAATRQRLSELTAGLTPHSAGLAAAAEKAATVLALQVRQQAFTLAIADSFMLVACSAVFCLIIVACMASVPTQYRQVVTAAAKPA
jgi:DHA2 family multidrug resistance protein